MMVQISGTSGFSLKLSTSPYYCKNVVFIKHTIFSAPSCGDSPTRRFTRVRQSHPPSRDPHQCALCHFFWKFLQPASPRTQFGTQWTEIQWTQILTTLTRFHCFISIPTPASWRWRCSAGPIMSRGNCLDDMINPFILVYPSAMSSNCWTVDFA